MNIYRYGKLAYAVQIIIILILIVAIIVFENFINPDNLLLMSVALAFFLIITFPYLIGISKRKVVIENDSISFFSFFSSLYTNKQERNFNIPFASISRIEYKKTIIPNKITLKISAQNRSNIIFIEPFMENHKELFSEICNKVKSANPHAYISPTVVRYIEQPLNS